MKGSGENQDLFCFIALWYINKVLDLTNGQQQINYGQSTSKRTN